MKTVKLQIANKPDVLDDMRVFSSIIRMAFNRYQDGLSEKEIRAYVSQRFSHNSWLIQSAVKEAQAIYLARGKKKIIFGGKRNLNQYLKGLITREQFKQKRSMPVCSCGEMLRFGNRLFAFNLPNNRVIYKPSRYSHKEIQFCPVRKKLANELAKVQELATQKKMPVTVKFTDKHLYLTYNESLIYNGAYKELKSNRVLGIDMNPNYIGVSVIEFDKNDEFRVLHKEVYDLTGLTKSSGKASHNKKSKYLTNKLKHETIAIAHKINKLVDYWKCSKLAIEDLSIKPSDKQKGKTFNRMCNNKWERSLFVNKLKMLAGIHKYELVEVNPAYSSIVGNFAYGNENTPDMVASAIEIARRAYKKFEKGWFYPKFNVETQDEQWKQTLGGVKTWKDLFRKIKETGLKYRFLLSDYVGNAVLSSYKYNKRWTHSIFS
ncbi:MAG: hypothetical protein IK038_02685 [Bacteroidaceae bacterium]|nr:hypothetical protein [Bacteroidaceae bacterium]